MKGFVRFAQNKWIFLGIGLLVGASIIIGIRIVNYTPKESVHYHANFALYVNGQQEQFTGPQYYEETAAATCSIEPVNTPNERAHMHDNINSVVHVEDSLVSWGSFMQNLHFAMGDNYLKTADNFYENNGQSKLSFILNGEKVSSIADRIIGDNDRLLINYGTQTMEELQKEYATVPSNADQYDTTQDPESCSGHGMQEDNMMDYIF